MFATTKTNNNNFRRKNDYKTSTTNPKKESSYHMYLWIPPLLALLISVRFHRQQIPCQNDQNMFRPVQTTASCHCGKVKLALNSPSAMRMVVYSKDYRGYYQSLNALAKDKGEKPVAPLDPWGGVDLTQVYASEIEVTQGRDLIETVLIRESSPIRRSYASCCHTPLWDIGNTGAAMLNTGLLAHLTDNEKPDIRFRIIGRQCLPSAAKDKDGQQLQKPAMSWSVPWSWPFVMMKRVDKDKAEPTPVDISQPKLMSNFQQG